MDAHSVSFEAGHYLDTVGFVSFDLAAADDAALNYTFIDADRASLMRATGTSAADFTTPHGKKVADAVSAARTRLGLDDVVGR